MHVSPFSQRTDDLIRTPVVLTVVFLQLNLITSFVVTNLDRLRPVDLTLGLWIAPALMVAVFIALVEFFHPMRHLGTRRQSCGRPRPQHPGA